MAEFPIAHALITSSIWACDGPTLRVWIALLALCETGVALVSKKALAYQARVSDAELKGALERLSMSTEDENTEWIERIEGGWKLHGLSRYEEPGTARAKSNRREYMRDFMARKRERERRAKQGLPPAEPVPVPAVDPEPVPPLCLPGLGNAPCSIEDAIAYAKTYTAGQGITAGLQITEEHARHWWDDRARVDWQTVKGQLPFPITRSNWQSDLITFARHFRNNDHGFSSSKKARAHSPGGASSLKQAGRYKDRDEDR